MPNYKNGKIYMLEPSVEYENGDIYYGATTQTLAQRLAGHKKTSTCKSKILLEKYGNDNVKIILIKDFPCNNKSQLDAEEAKYIRNNVCVNKHIPTGIIAEDRDDWLKQYKQSDDGKEAIWKYNQTEKRKESRQKYQQTDAYKAYQRQYQRQYYQRKKRSQSL